MDAVLALYDFASKQKYIYRTPKIKEISGASALLSGMYRRFPAVLKSQGLTLRYDPDAPFSLESFLAAPDRDGEVLYDGGGCLMVLWRSREVYVAANRALSVFLLTAAPGAGMTACCVPVTGAFEKDRTALYEQNSLRKNRFPASSMPVVTPFTQIDPMTFSPVVHKDPVRKLSLSADRVKKLAAYAPPKNACGRLEEDEGMLAVLYIDGNAMGKKLMACRSEQYDDGVRRLREFSRQVDAAYVTKPLAAIGAAGFPFRKIIGGGDEITLICRAEDALRILHTYFDLLCGEKLMLGDSAFSCTSCAGIAVFHAGSPFSAAYEIAEAACEQAKEAAHEKDGNYFSFYYCHSGITDVFDKLHENEQAHASGKPYPIDILEQFGLMAVLLRLAGRANVKALGAAAQRSPAAYRFETERINAYLPQDAEKFCGDEQEMRLVYDMAEFYDLWFAKEGDGQ